MAALAKESGITAVGIYGPTSTTRRGITAPIRRRGVADLYSSPRNARSRTAGKSASSSLVLESWRTHPSMECRTCRNVSWSLSRWNRHSASRETRLDATACAWRWSPCLRPTSLARHSESWKWVSRTPGKTRSSTYLEDRKLRRDHAPFTFRGERPRSGATSTPLASDTRNPPALSRV